MPVFRLCSHMFMAYETLNKPKEIIHYGSIKQTDG